MKTLDPLKPKDLKTVQLILEAGKKNMGFEANSIKIMARNPGILGGFAGLTANILGSPGALSPWQGIKLAFKNLIWTVRNLKNPNRVPLALRQMVAHLSSVASGCRYCQAHTLEGAHNAGISEEKLKALWSFETSDLFSEEEKSACRFAIAAGSVPNQVEAHHFESLKKYFSEEQIVELGATVALFGFLNRWNDTFATSLEDKPSEIAERIIGPKGWTAGKH